MPPSFSSSSQLHIHVSAQDRPGILAETLVFIVQTGWNVVDIKQFVFNGLLNLSILLDGCDESRILSLREGNYLLMRSKWILKSPSIPGKQPPDRMLPMPTVRL